MSLAPTKARRLFLTRSPSRLLLLSLLVAACAFTACSEDKNEPGPGPDPLENDASFDNGTDTGDDVGTNVAPDAEGLDGVMAGTWLVKRASDDALQVTLELRHKEGDDAVTGTYLLAEGPTTPAALDVASWRNERFNAAWSARIGGVDENFQISDALMQSESYMLGNYIDSRVAMGVDISIERTEDQ